MVTLLTLDDVHGQSKRKPQVSRSTGKEDKYLPPSSTTLHPCFLDTNTGSMHTSNPLKERNNTVNIFTKIATHIFPKESSDWQSMSECYIRFLFICKVFCLVGGGRKLPASLPCRLSAPMACWGLNDSNYFHPANRVPSSYLL